MKKTLKADTLERARGSFLGAPVSVTRDEDDPKRTRRLSPAEMNALVGGERYRIDAVGILVGVALAFGAGIFIGYAPKPVPKLPPPVRPAPTVLTLVAADLPPPERVLQRLTRTRAKPDIKKPLFQEKP